MSEIAIPFEDLEKPSERQFVVLLMSEAQATMIFERDGRPDGTPLAGVVEVGWKVSVDGRFSDTITIRRYNGEVIVGQLLLVTRSLAHAQHALSPEVPVTPYADSREGPFGFLGVRVFDTDRPEAALAPEEQRAIYAEENRS